MSKEIIRAENIVKEYHIGQTITKAVNGISLGVEDGEFIAITGKSGSGKSTLLYQLSLLDNPTSGSIFIDGKNTSTYSDRKKTNMRLVTFGYVFQDYALIPELTAFENVVLPLMMQGNGENAKKKVEKVLSQVGLGKRLHNRPSQLSGGEQQRVSIARAIVNNPRVLFADEPTANLDSVTSSTVMDTLENLHQQGLTIVMVTHEPQYAKMAKRIIHLSDGKIEESSS